MSKPTQQTEQTGRTQTTKTKICIVQSCEYSKGTNLPIRMFKVPQDVSRRDLWGKSLTSHGLNPKLPLNGMICINHFCESDLQPATKSRPIYLKINAVPTIFSAEKSHNEHLSVSNPSESNHSHGFDRVDSCLNESCVSIRMKYEELQNVKINSDVNIQKLQKKIADLKASIQNQTDHIKRLDMEVKRLTETKVKLKRVVAELQQQDMLRKDATDILKVR